MSDIKKDSATLPPQPVDKLSSKDAVSSKRLEEDADEMASRSGKVENEYDESHDIFTK